MRRHLFVSIFLVSLMVPTFEAQSARANKPNVLVILVDDMGYSDPSFMGGETPTPNIDRLAAGGLRFTQCYNSARCCPSRAMLVSGLYPHQTGIGSFASAQPRTNRGPAYVGRLNDRCVTFGQVLKASGYQTYMVGKWHMEEPGPIDRGFDQFYGFVKGYEQDQWEPARYQRLPKTETPEIEFAEESFYATDAFTDYSLEFLKQARTKGQPWLLYLAHSAPHFPVQAPKNSVDRFIDEYRRGWEVLRAERFERMKKIGLADRSWKLTDRSLVPIDRDDIANGYPGRPNPGWDSLPEDRREDLARRGAIAAAMMHHVDEGIGRLIADLETHGELDDTLILFMSDNGACYEWGPFGFDGPSRRGVTKLHTGDELENMGGPGTYHSYGSAWANLGNTPLRLYKHYCHEGGNCTPLIAYWPSGIKRPDRWVREPIALIDVMPTLCEVAGANYPKEFAGKAITPVEGKSLKPIFEGAEQLEDRALFSEHQKARSVRRGRWKAVWSKRMPGEITWELYDIKADRCETTNVADQHPEIVRALSEEWVAWAKKVNADPYINFGNEGNSESAPVDAVKRVEPDTRANSGWTASPSPPIKKIALEIKGTFESPSKPTSGVIVSHGGNQHGYAVYLDRGKLIFAVRRAGRLTLTESLAIGKGATSFTATLSSQGKIRLATPEQRTSPADAGGLIDVQPIDSMSIGFDDRTAAAGYSPPNRFEGTIRDVSVNGKPVVENVSKSNAEPGTSASKKPDGLMRSMKKPISLHQLDDVAGAVAKPFYVDPCYSGSCDPEIVWNAVENQWLIYYTARRAKRKTGTYAGTALGVVSSPDLLHWTFRGYCTFDGVKGKPDNDVTHWAPGVIVDGDTLHLFATYKDNAKPPWGGSGVIRHYSTSLADPIDGWKLVGVPKFNQPDPIDVSLIKSDDHFRAYYRVGKGGGLQWATSRDLTTWENRGKCLGDVNAKDRGFGYQEAPYVFEFDGAFWMLTDPHDGLAVFRSDDGVNWIQKDRILKADGTGPRDTTRARHPSVAVIDGRAYIFYHVEPNRPYPNPPAEQRTVEQKLAYLQVAELVVEGDKLVCHRDRPVVVNEDATGRWSKEKANDWYRTVSWPVGTNFVPSTAINQLEMWQEETFDPETIDRELGWAAAIGMNSMRVFLHDLAWKQDPEGFLDRVDRYLAIADKHEIRTMFVFFDGVWNPSPQAGEQPQPRPRVHNSGWVQSPGRAILDHPAKQDALKDYVVAVLDRFKDDQRVLVWDLFNEPENSNAGKFGGDSETPDLPKGLKRQRALELLQKTFTWAREVNPSQPLTAGVWGGPNWLEDPDLIETYSLQHSDVITFHTYNGPADTRRMIDGLKKYGRPVMCTEYLARGNGSTFEQILPIFQAHKIGAYNWGLVDGKTNTIYPWDSWRKKYDDEPDPWHHEVFRRDGTPYKLSEVTLIKRLTAKNLNKAASTDRKPNFVFILTDDQGWTGLSTPMDKSRIDSKSDFYRTPNIDRLAASGMRFSRGYSPAPNCSPSRYANLTGKTCARLSFTDIVGRGHSTDLNGKQKLRPGGKATRQIREADVTIAELLKTLPDRYRTAHFGKWHLSGGGPGKHGFDASDGSTGNREGSLGPTIVADPKQAFSLASKANEFIAESVALDQPFYCQISHYAVHAKIQHRDQTLTRTRQWDAGSNHSDPAYAAMVSDLDQSVGMVLDQLERLDIEDNTYVIYQADNGSPQFLSESPPLKRYKPEIWEGGIRVPTFISGPGVAPNSQCDQPMMGIDLLPTIWELAEGHEDGLPKDIDGGSLVSAIKAISSGAEEESFVRRPGELVVHSPHYVLTKDGKKNQRPSSAIFDGKWKLVAWYETGEVSLFDLQSDISESQDVGNDYPGVKQDLYKRLRNYLVGVDAHMPTLDPKHSSHRDPSPGDADADGLPDEWEFRNLLTHRFSGDDDTDGDGLSNLTEFKSKTDPLTR